MDLKPQFGSTRQILAQAWPMFIAQLAVVLNSAIDTAMAGQLSATDLAGVALGSSIYVSVYVAFLGVVSALGPIAGHHYGAGALHAIGRDVVQALWLSVALAVLGIGVLVFSQPWFALARPSADVRSIAETYLIATAYGLPGALAARVFVALNSAVSRPIVTMGINLTALALKVPLNALFIHGLGPIPALGGAGCGVATAVLGWLSLALSYIIWRFDPFYARLHDARQSRRPNWQQLRAFLKLGVPIGLSTMFEVTSFTMMAVLIARLGAATLGGHQIIANLAAILFMVPLALGFSSSALAAQALGAGHPRVARRIVLRGLRLGIGIGVAAASTVWLARESIVAIYSKDPEVTGVALSLIIWAVLFHVFDAIQGVCAFVLRSYKVTLAPMLIYGVSLWGLGLGGGFLLAYHGTPVSAPLGAAGFWIAALVALGVAAAALLWIALAVAADAVRASAIHDPHKIDR